MGRNLIAALDIGTSKIAAALGEINHDGTVSVLALSRTKSAGVKYGGIVDIDAAAGAIDDILEDVERISGKHVSTLRAGFTGVGVNTITNKAVVPVSLPVHGITTEDVDRAIHAARMVVLSADRSIVHIVPRQFTVDGTSGIIDPIDMVGTRLEVEVVIATVPSAALQNMLKTINRTGTKVKEVGLNTIMAADAVLLPAEKEMGVALVDIGGGTCNIGIFLDGYIVFTAVLPVGGDYITRDLAIGLKTTMEEAQTVKEENGLAILKDARDDITITMKGIYGKETRQVSERVIASIIEPRVGEILELINTELERSGFKNMLPGGIVLTGGTALLKGILPACEEYLKLPARVGFPENIGTVPSDCYSPEYTALLGSLLHAAKDISSGRDPGHELFSNGILTRVVSWFKDLFR
ncbi:MAG: cell division protein FtsA [Chitinophagales bacterium]